MMTTARLSQLLFVPIFVLVLPAGCQRVETTSTSGFRLHPVFHTVVTGKVSLRPAIQVDIVDASESWLSTAELYLTVQSSRFPSDTWVVLPLNVGDFQGCRARFVQLPFEVQPGEVLLVNLLDDDELTATEEALVVKGCRTTGFCIVVAGALYSPKAAQFVAPAVDSAAEVLGQATINGIRLNRFENFGSAEFIVADVLPSQPNDANKLTILDNRNYARVTLKVYGSDVVLPFTDAKGEAVIGGENAGPARESGAEPYR